VSQPDLFVVCKNCGAEVSPYVTECPYCGQRVRKRAPKLERGAPGEPAAPRSKRRRRTRLPRLRAQEIAGIAPEVRPYGTFALILVSLLATVVIASGNVGIRDLGGIVVPIDDAVWRWFATPFVHDSLGYQFVAMVAVGIFGTLLERRFGPLPVVVLFLLAGAAGAAVAVTLEVPPVPDNPAIYPVLGANGAALGLLMAWFVDDRLASRRGEDRENDLIGVYVIAAVLVLLSLAVAEANLAAAVGGAAVGALVGAILPIFTRRRA
jgi:membrane associated rhomboid family serine protease